LKVRWIFQPGEGDQGGVVINPKPRSESRIATDDLICKFDIHLQISYANELFCQFIGCSEGALGGKSLLDLFPDDRQPISELISQMLANPRCLTFETHTVFTAVRVLAYAGLPSLNLTKMVKFQQSRPAV